MFFFFLMFWCQLPASQQLCVVLEEQHKYTHKTIRTAPWLGLLLLKGSRSAAKIQVSSLDLSNAIGSLRDRKMLSTLSIFS